MRSWTVAPLFLLSLSVQKVSDSCQPDSQVRHESAPFGQGKGLYWQVHLIRVLWHSMETAQYLTQRETHAQLYPHESLCRLLQKRIQQAGPKSILCGTGRNVKTPVRKSLALEHAHSLASRQSTERALSSSSSHGLTSSQRSNAGRQIRLSLESCLQIHDPAEMAQAVLKYSSETLHVIILLD